MVMPRLLYGQVGAGVLQLRGKGNGIVVCDGVEIPPQDWPSRSGTFLWPIRAIIKEIRSHLEHHDIGALISDFPLLQGDFSLLFSNFPFLQDDFLLAALILLDLIGQDEAVHGQSGENSADVDAHAAKRQNTLMRPCAKGYSANEKRQLFISKYNNNIKDNVAKRIAIKTC